MMINKKIDWTFISFVIFGILVKLLLGTIFADDVLKNGFLPFLDYAVSKGVTGQSPYAKFLVNSPEAFPYPALMLVILSIPRFLFGWISQSYSFNLFLFRLPILAADLTTFLILLTWLEKHKKKILVIYWFSPVLIYISYIHGQLDAIPIALLFTSLYFIFKEKKLMAVLFLCLSVCTKTHIILVLPFYLIYFLSKRVNLSTILLYLLITIGIFLSVNAMFLTDSAFWQMVYQNREQNRLWNLYISFGDNLKLYLIPALYLILVLRAFVIRKFNRDLFILYLGFSFGIILLLVVPTQGWYYWILPFFSYFFIKYFGRIIFLFAALQVCYFIFFYLHSNGQIWSSPSNGYTLISIAFTLLQTILFLNAIYVYNRGVNSLSKHKITAKPYMIGIGGNSGTGKTTLADSLAKIIGKENCSVLGGDAMHRWERGDQNWRHLTHLDPESNYLYDEISNLKRLRSGKSILRREYDHDTGKFTDQIKQSPRDFIIYEGLHSFFIESLRRLYDLKIFIRLSPELEMHRKIQRDNKQRGYSKAQILDELERRKNSTEKYINNQMNYADILLDVSVDAHLDDLETDLENENLVYSLTMSNSICIEPIVEKISHISTFKISTEYFESKQIVTFHGHVDHDSLSEATTEIIGQLDEIGIMNVCWPEDTWGVVLLFIFHYIISESDE